ncbi:MAG: GTP-binding protein [Cyanobacteria bacterium P01_H01_bin.15]
MPLPRLLLLIGGVLLILGFGIWLIDALTSLFYQISFSSPFLGFLLILLIIVLLGLFIGTFIYYFFLTPTQKKRGRPLPRVSLREPAEKITAATATLQSVREQVTQIEDDIAQQALIKRSQEIEANLARGELQVLVFGTGSAGKTSLINALLGQIAGKVEPTIGTTQTGAAYRLALPELGRTIAMIDTPGILEPGVAGTERGRLARELAAQANLLLFVVDNDLRQSELEPLQALAAIGKRSLLILNKCDRYTEDDLELILRSLREKVANWIAPADVVAIAAAPASVCLPNGDLITPEIEILPLVKRLANVLRAEGDDLLADNMLLQSQRLGEEARKLLEKQQRRQAEKIIQRYQWIGAGVIAVTPLPVVDMLATAAVNAQMVVELGKVFDCQINGERGRELALSLGKTLVSLGVVKGAAELLARALQFHMATYLVGKLMQAITAAYLTRIAGKSFVEYFQRDQDWGDGGIAEVVQRQFKLSRKDEFIKAFVTDAIAQVWEPVKATFSPEESEAVAELEHVVETLPVPQYQPLDDWATDNRSDDW